MTEGKISLNKQVLSEQSIKPEIGWCLINGRECLKFTFRGTLTEIDAIDAVSKWKKMFSTRKDEEFILKIAFKSQLTLSMLDSATQKIETAEAAQGG